jgi:hypothetical protein
MKKLLISVCLIFLSVLCIPVFCSAQSIDYEFNYITSSGEEFNNPKDIVEYISNVEDEFDDFISKNEDKKQNSKVFGIYLKKLESLRDELGSSIMFSGRDYSDYGIDVYFKHFANPKINVLQLEPDVGLIIDYKYICKKYCSSLNNSWKDYIKYVLAEEDDYDEFHSHDGEDSYEAMYVALQKKWIKKWIMFTLLHPNFPLNAQIKEDTLHRGDGHFNVKIYLASIIITDLIILSLLAAVIFFVRKYNLISKSITFTKNQLSNVDIEHLQKGLIVFGIIAVAIIIFVRQHNNAELKCDSKFAEEEIIKIFKNNDNKYLNNIDNVEEIKMSDFEPMEYDSGINKYTCRAVLTMYSTSESPIDFYGPFNSLKFNVKYSTFKERGKNKVRASWKMMKLYMQDRAK